MSRGALAELIMPRTDEGEFELVLGNKQLLSIFFVVVVLLGVFFTMGYVVGRNTAGQEQMAAAPGQPLVVDPGGAGAPPPAAAPVEPAPAKPEPLPPPPRTQPAPAVPTESLAPPPPAPAKPVTPPPTAPPPGPGGPSEPAAGTTWLQVAATSLPEGEVLRDVLAKRGFSVHLAPVPGQEVIRVLVGPVNTPDALVQTRSKLQEAGFKPFARKYQ
jgi:cell division protein FtsN